MINAFSKLDWGTLKVIIFDVDGTLYQQAPLRRMMMQKLLLYYLFRPWRIRDLFILAKFRHIREHKAGTTDTNIAQRQYEWLRHYAPKKVEQVVQQWLMKAPLPYLMTYAYPEVQLLFHELKERGYQIAVYSDYPAEEKLAALALSADIIISSTDAKIDRLKPHPKGLQYICEQLKCAPQEALFIGDRADRDGACAKNARMPYWIIEKAPNLNKTWCTRFVNYLRRM